MQVPVLIKKLDDVCNHDIFDPLNNMNTFSSTEFTKTFQMKQSGISRWVALSFS